MTPDDEKKAPSPPAEAGNETQGRDEGAQAKRTEAEQAKKPGDGPAPKGLTLAGVIEAYEANSGRASENVRVLCFAGLGLVWVLSGQQLAGLTRDLLAACLFLTATLLFDFLQYSVAAVRFERFVESQSEKGVKREEEVNLPLDFHKWPTRLYWTKLGSLTFAYVILIGAVVVRLHGAPAPASATEVMSATPAPFQTPTVRDNADGATSSESRGTPQLQDGGQPVVIPADSGT